MMQHSLTMMLWGFIATCAVAIIQEGTQYFGFSRMSFPFLIGSFFTGNRRRAAWIGFLSYLLGGWMYTSVYYFMFGLVGGQNWLTGALLGFFQGIFMLMVILSLLPSIHPRMASPYDGPEAERRIEPPGFMAMNYGVGAPVVHIIGQVVFGIILGLTYHMKS